MSSRSLKRRLLLYYDTALNQPMFAGFVEVPASWTFALRRTAASWVKEWDPRGVARSHQCQCHIKETLVYVLHCCSTRARSLYIWYDVLLFHCIVGLYVFTLYVTFHQNAGDVMLTLAYVTFKLTWLLVIYDTTCTYAAFHEAVKTLFKRDLWFRCRYVPNLLKYRHMRANYFNTL